MSTLINWLVSAIILWAISLLPFIDMSFSGIWTIIVVALVLGLINAILVPIAKNFFKNASPLVLIIASLVVDAAAIWLAAWFVRGFHVQFWPSGIIVAAILALINGGFTLKK